MDFFSSALQKQCETASGPPQKSHFVTHLVNKAETLKGVLMESEVPYRMPWLAARNQVPGWLENSTVICADTYFRSSYLFTDKVKSKNSEL